MMFSGPKPLCQVCGDMEVEELELSSLQWSMGTTSSGAGSSAEMVPSMFGICTEGTRGMQSAKKAGSLLLTVVSTIANSSSLAAAMTAPALAQQEPGFFQL